MFVFELVTGLTPRSITNIGRQMREVMLKADHLQEFMIDQSAPKERSVMICYM